MLSQHPLLAMSPAARRALLYEWYCHNKFSVDLDIGLRTSSRSFLERALILLGPRLTVCLITPMAGRALPRLHIHCYTSSGGVTFACLLQWFCLFYDGPLSDRIFAGIQTGFGLQLPSSTLYKLVWGDDNGTTFDQECMSTVLRELGMFAGGRTTTADVARHVYNWLVHGNSLPNNEERVTIAKDRVCEMIGTNFKALGFRGALRIYD
jgi:hypothetical protein